VCKELPQGSALTPEDDADLTEYLWLIERESIKTAFPMKNSDETEWYTILAKKNKATGGRIKQ
jgi:hypothetical protein